MTRVVIVGAGGHAQVVADILRCAPRSSRELRVVGYVDDDARLTGLRLLGLPVLGLVSSLRFVPHDRVIVAIGDNSNRRDVFLDLQQKEEELLTACHRRAVVAASARIGIGSMLCAGVVVNPAAEIGCNVIVNTGATVDHHCRIGSHAHIAPGVHLGGEVEIGEGSLVGIGATVMPRVKIGSNTVVGAGAVVTRDLPDRVVAVGVPASIVSKPASKPRKAWIAR